MSKLQREELLDFVTYNEQREGLRPRYMETKQARRVQHGEALTFLFENRDTVYYQVQEMMRIEQIVRESDIMHELQTYNELIGGPGELGCTLLIGIDSPERRDEKLVAWMGLLEHIYLLLEDGTRIRGRWDERQVGDTRLSSVQYLKFDTGGEVPVAVGTDFDDSLLQGETPLSESQRAALASDLAAAAVD
ncbi:MAG: DUF3501 family protein [Myxococcota bacterium]|nr:DUF3501 family protein [Myxococcota bacterium]